MTKRLYVSPLSLDSFLGGENYEWSSPSEVFLAFITEIMRPVGTYIYGRRMYQTMAYWENPEIQSSFSPAEKDFASVSVGGIYE